MFHRAASSVRKEPQTPALSVIASVRRWTASMFLLVLHEKVTTLLLRKLSVLEETDIFTCLTGCLLGSLVCHMVVPPCLSRATCQ